ncbi:MAG: Uma2 family endonuclease [Solirubrobacteraceae bacterium]
MATDVEIDELHRISVDDYHRLAEAGAGEFLPNVELIDGLLVRKDMKSPQHEDAIAWLLEWLMFGVDRRHFAVRAASALTLTHSEPEPDLMVIARDRPRPYHPATAVLAIEVSATSLRRDLRRKAVLYAEAGVGEYWVHDVRGGRIVVHRAAREGGYSDVRELRAGGQIADPPAGLPALDVDELLRATAA